MSKKKSLKGDFQAKSIDLTKTLLDFLSQEQREKVNWGRRAGSSGLDSWGSADGSFGDVVSMTKNGRLDEMGFDTLLFSYGKLLKDTKTPRNIIRTLIPPMTAAFLSALEKTPLERQEKKDLLVFSNDYSVLCCSGRFREKDIAEINKVVNVMSNNWIQKLSFFKKTEPISKKGKSGPKNKFGM